MGSSPGSPSGCFQPAGNQRMSSSIAVCRSSVVVTPKCANRPACESPWGHPSQIGGAISGLMIDGCENSFLMRHSANLRRRNGVRVCTWKVPGLIVIGQTAADVALSGIADRARPDVLRRPAVATQHAPMPVRSGRGVGGLIATRNIDRNVNWVCA